MNKNELGLNGIVEDIIIRYQSDNEYQPGSKRALIESIARDYMLDRQDAYHIASLLEYYLPFITNR